MSEHATAQVARLKPPGWLDGRLIAGVVLVLISVAVGAKLVASSDRYDEMWAASHDIAAGSILTRADVHAVKVKFHDAGASTTVDGTEQGYFPATATTATVVGRTSSQALFAGQLIPVGAVHLTVPDATRLVTLPVARLHMPKGAVQGMQVDLYVTVKGSDGQPAPELVLANVTVADTITDSSGLGDSGGSGVVLVVPVADVNSVVAAAEEGSVDLVRVPSGQTVANPVPGDFVAGPATPTPSADAVASSPMASPTT
jgi:hypothetical protein